MFGYVQSLGRNRCVRDLLASTLNANLTIWRSAPAPVELERLTIDGSGKFSDSMLKRWLFSAVINGNLAALAAARQTRTFVSRLRMYASSATHFSITSSGAFGIGRRIAARCDRRALQNADGRSVTKITADLEPLFHSASLGCRNRRHRRSRPLTRDSDVADRSNLDAWMEVMAPSPFSRISQKYSQGLSSIRSRLIS